MSLLMAETIYLFPYSNRYVCDFSLYKKISTTCQTSWQRAFKTKTSEFQQTFTQFWHVKNSTLFHSSSSMFQYLDRVILDIIYIPGISYLKNIAKYLTCIVSKWKYLNPKLKSSANNKQKIWLLENSCLWK